LGRPVFLVFSVITIGIGALLFGPAGSPTPSGVGAILGLEIVARAAAIMVLARWIGMDATAYEFAHLFGRFGLRWVGFALGIAINALPILERSSRRTWDAMRMRGGLRQRRWRSFRLIAIATLTNALLHADAQADAATARGFRLDLPPEPPPSWIGGERVLVVSGWVLSGLAVFFALRG
jgi:energy-coupling factor transporter transmembrane protein EcfT